MGYYHADGRPYRGGEERKDLQYRQLALNSTNPTYSNDTVSLDLSRAELLLAIDFKSSLGVSSKVYSWLQLFGSVAAFLLGSGVVWKLLPKKKRADPSPIVIASPNTHGQN
jgi:hypothetical protein